jgi:predicted ABC-class ATPase
MGGSGDYFADADTVIVMDNYTPSDQTTAAHSIASQHAATLAAAGVPQPPQATAGAAGVWVTPRVPQRVYSGHEDSRGVKTHVRGLHHIQVGRQAFQTLENLKMNHMFEY